MTTPERMTKIKRVVGQRQADVVVVLQDVHDPHNAEAIFRSCDAFGVQDVYLIFERENPWDPKKIGKKSSSSAHKWLDFHTFNSTEECFSLLKKKGYSLFATALDSNAQEIYRVVFSGKIALLVGNEHAGLSLEALQKADCSIMVPMRGMVESFNVSVAAALCLYELTRQRLAAGKIKNFAKSFQKKLADDFSRRSSKRLAR